MSAGVKVWFVCPRFCFCCRLVLLCFTLKRIPIREDECVFPLFLVQCVSAAFSTQIRAQTCIMAALRLFVYEDSAGPHWSTRSANANAHHGGPGILGLHGQRRPSLVSPQHAALPLDASSGTNASALGFSCTPLSCDELRSIRTELFI